MITLIDKEHIAYISLIENSKDVTREVYMHEIERFEDAQYCVSKCAYYVISVKDRLYQCINWGSSGSCRVVNIKLEKLKERY